MKKLSLEKEINNIISNEIVSRNVVKDSYNQEVETVTFTHKGFKCSFPADMSEDILKAARAASRRQAERYPVPASQKALTWISKRRYLVPLLLSIFKLHKGDPTNASTGAISEALLANQEPTCKRYWGTVFQEDIPNISDLFYAIGTMPPAWKSAALAM